VLTITRSRPIDVDDLAGRAPFLTAPTLSVQSGQLPDIPAAWRPVYGREIATPTQRFTAYSTVAGMSIGMHSTIGLHPELTGRLIALVNLGGHRVAVHAGDDRLEARWTCGSLTHRLIAEPVELGAFMELILNLTWPAPPLS
jgi:hypothetical protein